MRNIADAPYKCWREHIKSFYSWHVLVGNFDRETNKHWLGGATLFGSNIVGTVRVSFSTTTRWF